MSIGSCEEILSELAWVAGGSASAERTSEVLLHLARCEGCRRAMAEEFALREGLAAVLAEAPRVTARAWASIEARLPARRDVLAEALEACGAPPLAVRVLRAACAAADEGPVLEWLQPWIRLAAAT